MKFLEDKRCDDDRRNFNTKDKTALNTTNRLSSWLAASQFDWMVVWSPDKLWYITGNGWLLLIIRVSLTEEMSE